MTGATKKCGRELAVFITFANVSRELRIKVDSGKQFGISFKGAVKKFFGNNRDFGNFSWENGNTDPQRAS